ncbi:uncharacterized protein LOC141670562 isoform X2 [Apium graveolens]|uniref:uncharacterized protein LOC141670562 isoform X2 n=1 Tax=Apium graveolens TaxID=4045 RepID=UPI003D7BBC94
MAFFGPNMEALEVIVSDLVLSSAINSSVFQEALEDKVSDQIFGSAISTSVFQWRCVSNHLMGSSSIIVPGHVHMASTPATIIHFNSEYRALKCLQHIDAKNYGQVTCRIPIDTIHTHSQKQLNEIPELRNIRTNQKVENSVKHLCDRRYTNLNTRSMAQFWIHCISCTSTK